MSALGKPDVVYESVRLWRCAAERARIDVADSASDGGRESGLEGLVDERWRELVSANPRLFDGAMLAVDSFDPVHGSVACRRERYRRLAVRPDVDTGVRLLAVKGVVTHGDEALMIRRNPGTHMYGGMWEIGPAGGVDPEEGMRGYQIDHGALSGQLARELREESGVLWDGTGAELICMFTSDESFCLNIVLRVELKRAMINEQSREWDADAVEWVPITRFGAFIERTCSDGIVPNSVALAMFLGWW